MDEGIYHMPSVTQVLSPWTDFSKIPNGVLEYAADRGTRVHAICAAIAKGLFVPDIPDDCKGYVESFRLWFKHVKRVIFVEPHLVHPIYKYCGHPDLLVEMNGGEIVLPDLKTPLALQKVWPIQLAGYKKLIEDGFANEHGAPTYRLDRISSLRLDPKGKTPKMKYYEESKQDFQIFLSCLNAWRYFNE